METLKKSIDVTTIFLEKIDLDFYSSHKRKNGAKDVIFHNIASVLDNSVNSGSATLSKKTGNDTSTSGIEAASNKIPMQVFQDFADALLACFAVATHRVLAVDGSVIRINKKIKSKSQFLSTNTESYKMGYLTVIYDVIKRVP